MVQTRNQEESPATTINLGIVAFIQLLITVIRCSSIVGCEESIIIIYEENVDVVSTSYDQ